VALAGARIFHVNVNCSHLERSRRFYSEALGFTEAVRTAPAAAQPGEAFGLGRARWDASILVGAGGIDAGAIDLLEWQEPPPVGAPSDSLLRAGFQRIGLGVADLDETAGRIVALGGRVWSEPFEHALGGGGALRLVMAEDPDGTALELFEAGRPSLGFVAVACSDLERSLGFYRALGFEERARFATDDPDGAHLRVAGPVAMDEVLLAAPGGGDVSVILVSFRRPPPIPGAARPANTLGPWRVALLVDDVEAGADALRSAGARAFSPPATMAMGEGLPDLRFVCAPGPDGEVVELIERPAG
jgi:catechol 2,3-dioxygenase-like lactoylglutathione lyase family enzyme